MRARVSDLIPDAALDMAGRNIENVGTLYGQREVLQQEETLIKQTIVPSAAGAEALVVRDVSNTIDRAVFREDGTGQVRELTVGDIAFANGFRLTEVDGGIALLSPEGRIVRLWREGKAWRTRS